MNIHVALADALRLGQPPAGTLAKPVFAVGEDRQTPHTRDQIYFVARGTGRFLNGTDTRPVTVGQVHRFEQFSIDFAVRVAGYGSDGGEAAGQATE